MTKATALALADVFVIEACRENDIPYDMVDAGSVQAIGTLTSMGMSMQQATNVIMEPYLLFIEGGCDADDAGMVALAHNSRPTRWIA